MVRGNLPVFLTIGRVNQILLIDDTGYVANSGLQLQHQSLDLKILAKCYLGSVQFSLWLTISLHFNKLLSMYSSKSLVHQFLYNTVTYTFKKTYKTCIYLPNIANIYHSTTRFLLHRFNSKQGLVNFDRANNWPQNIWAVVKGFTVIINVFSTIKRLIINFKWAINGNS